MNYIGSKHKLLPFLKKNIHSVVGNDLSEKIFCDLFAGTGVVGRAFKNEVRSIISNDLEYYSFVLNKNYISNHRAIPNKEIYLQRLSNLELKEGFIFKNYSTSKRQYFSDQNGKIIDAIRTQIEDWFTTQEISKNLYFFLLASLIESADKVANTASIYGAFLKQIKVTAKRTLLLKPAEFDLSQNSHLVYNEDSNKLIDTIEGDILYLDPPYNSRQYGANYHLLNTIALYDNFKPKGKTGQRKYNKSKYCKKRLVASYFEELIKSANFKYIFLSYNNEGIMSIDEVKRIMSSYGKYDLVSTNYKRFKADSTANRNHKAKKTQEYLHILEKN